MRTSEEVSGRISYLTGIIKGLELSKDDIDIDKLISDFKNQILGLQYALDNIKFKGEEK